MPTVKPIHAITFQAPENGNISELIAPPYDVLDEGSRDALLAASAHNIVKIDLPHLPPKTVGPDESYEKAGRTFRQWLDQGVLRHGEEPALFVYRQTFTNLADDQVCQRLGVFANVALEPLGRRAGGHGGIHAHEQTFSAPKEDRLKLMRATRAQLSPIFGFYDDADGQVRRHLAQQIQTAPTFHGTTGNDNVRHEVWSVEEPDAVARLTAQLTGRDITIADGHHRYTTALNYRKWLAASKDLPAGHPAADCLFMLVAMEDPGMIVLPTHRVLGGMSGFTFDRFVSASENLLSITPFSGTDLAALESSLSSRPAIGLYNPADKRAPLSIATAVDDDPLAEQWGQRSDAWRRLDVVIVQHLIVERICQPLFCSSDPSGQVQWKFPHTLDQLQRQADAPGYQLGLIMRPTPLESVRQVSEVGELMPQKSTFFYPKVATGLVIHPLTGR